MAYEAVSTFVGFCFDELASNPIEAFTDPKNVASGRLLARLARNSQRGRCIGTVDLRKTS